MRLAALAALSRAALDVRGVPVGIYSPGDWHLPADRLPSIVVRTGHETKDAELRGMPQFTTTCTLEIKASIEATTGQQAQDDIDTLWYGIENALLLDFALVGASQKFATIETTLTFSADGARHFAGIEGAFAYEFFEAFDPVISPPPVTLPDLEGITVNVDLVNVADRTGTYDDAPFPDAVTPAPRTHGPDGRNEGTLSIPPADPDGPQ